MIDVNGIVGGIILFLSILVFLGFIGFTFFHEEFTKDLTEFLDARHKRSIDKLHTQIQLEEAKARRIAAENAAKEADFNRALAQHNRMRSQ